jgi:hypothetical protein
VESSETGDWCLAERHPQAQQQELPISYKRRRRCAEPRSCSGSPGCNICRTFRTEFRWLVYRAQASRPKAKKTYRNPVALALEWRKALDRGHYSSPADLARKEGISRARVTQILNLLRLSPRVIEITRSLGDPLHSPLVTERQLRRLINLPRRKQLKELTIILSGMQSIGEPTRRS